MNKEQQAKARAALASFWAGSASQSVKNAYDRGDVRVIDARKASK